jgi:hypothetical protein
VGFGDAVGPLLGLGLGDALGLALGDGFTVGDGNGLKVGIGTETPPVDARAPPGGTITYRCSPGKMYPS